MKCPKVRKKLSAFLDNELGKRERKIIREHLKICPLCARELKELSLVWGVVKELEGVKSSPYLWNNLLKKISQPSLIRKRTFHILAPVAATVILIGGILTGILIGRIFYSERMSLAQKENTEFLYLNTFDDFPPDSIGGIYTTLVSSGD